MGRAMKAFVAVVLWTAVPSCYGESDYSSKAREVTDYMIDNFQLPESGLYREESGGTAPGFMWSNGILFSAFAGAARHDREEYAQRRDEFFRAMDCYWDEGATPPGYEPVPDRAGVDDKYYDDNAWMAITFLEAYKSTGDRAYLARAEASLRFVLSGHDEEQGGGIWWHEARKDGTKNTCVTAPAAVACLNLARFDPNRADRDELISMANGLARWTKSTLQADDGLFHDRIKVATGRVIRGKLSYNSALMIRAYLGLYHVTGDAAHLEEAQRISHAAERFVDPRSGRYRDHVKWAHLLLEADLELYRLTKDEELFERARSAADAYYRSWHADKPTELIENASIARALWLMADVASEDAQRFWREVDRAK